MTFQTPNSPAAIVDALGRIKAQAAALSDQEAALKTALKATGLTAVDGEMFRATITEVEAERIATDKVRALLDTLVAEGKITRQKAKAMFAKSTSTTIRITARRMAV